MSMASSSDQLSDCRIFMCYSDTGGGHKYAAEAVRMALDELMQKDLTLPRTEVIVESVVKKSNALNYLFIQLYNYLLRHHQNWMKYYIWCIELVKPNQSMLGYRLLGTYIKDMLARVQPSLVVSVHPMVNHYMALALKDAGLAGQTKFIIVVTDPNGSLWGGWACKDADLIIAPNDLAQARLLELGIPLDRIRTIGMPIEPKFLLPAKVKREELLRQLGLEPERLTILLSGGWAGGGAVANIYKALEQVKRPVQVIILCGHSDNLLANMNDKNTQSSLPTAVLGYTDSLSDLMSACDLLVTKGGGLTTFQAVARRLPMALDLLTEPMPQEIGTINMLIEANLAKPLRKVDDIVPIIESLKVNADRESQALPAIHNLNRTDAVYDIAKTILSFLPTVKPIVGG